jgi:uncharacterized membrane protein (DUF4010 family)
LVVAYDAQIYLGDAGVALSGLLSGAVDADAATVSASRLSGAQLHTTSLQTAAASIVLALAANSVTKAVIVYTNGERAMARPVLAVLLGSGTAALLGLGATMLFAPGS